MENEPVEGAITFILKHDSVITQKSEKNAPSFFLIFAENFTLLSRNVIKLTPFGASKSEYKKSTFSMWLYKGA